MRKGSEWRPGTETDETDENDELVPDEELVMGKDVFEQLKMTLMKDPEPGTFQLQKGASHEAKGHLVLFYLKFHYELNFI